MGAGSGLHCKRGGRISVSRLALAIRQKLVLTLAIRHGFVLVLEHVLARGLVLEHVLAHELATNQHATRVRGVPHFVHECAEGKHEGTYYETSKILD